VQSAKLRFKTTALTTFQAERGPEHARLAESQRASRRHLLLENVKVLEGECAKSRRPASGEVQVSGTLVLNGVKQPLGGSALGWRENDRLIVTAKQSCTLQYGLPQVRKAFHDGRHAGQDALPVSFILPPDYALK